MEDALLTFIGNQSTWDRSHNFPWKFPCETFSWKLKKKVEV